MVPIVTHSPTTKDKRKKKISSYQEAGYAYLYAGGSVTPVYAATMSNVSTTGKYVRQTALSAGLGSNTKIYAVGEVERNGLRTNWMVNLAILVQ